MLRLLDSLWQHPNERVAVVVKAFLREVDDWWL